MDFDFTPVIIIGAGRSGTNMLRDSICTIPSFSTWDCDEINPIWRHGNTGHPDDLFTEEHADPKVTRFIRQQFFKQWKRQGKPEFLVEKTCANSLRVSFIAKVLPEAKFIYIVRDGTDVTASARRRWKGEMEIPSLPYYWSKIRNTPFSDLPNYAWRFIASRIDFILGKKQHMSFWGPQFPSLKYLPKNTPLLELCARQWTECVEASDNSFATIPETKWTYIRYEDFVADPNNAMEAILGFLQVDINAEDIEASISNISSKSVGKAKLIKNHFDKSIVDILSPSLTRHGYLEL